MWYSVSPDGSGPAVHCRRARFKRSNSVTASVQADLDPEGFPGLSIAVPTQDKSLQFGCSFQRHSSEPESASQYTECHRTVHTQGQWAYREVGLQNSPPKSSLIKEGGLVSLISFFSFSWKKMWVVSMAMGKNLCSIHHMLMCLYMHWHGYERHRVETLKRWFIVTKLLKNYTSYLYQKSWHFADILQRDGKMDTMLISAFLVRIFSHSKNSLGLHEDWKHVKFRYYVFKVAQNTLIRNDTKMIWRLQL